MSSPRPSRTRAVLGGLLVLCLLAGAAGAAAGAAGAADWPRPAGPVADYAKVIPPEDERTLAALARELFRQTGDALVVATIPELGDASVEEKAVELFERWGIGQKGKDNGLLLLVAVRERRLRIEVGYGLEGIITAARAGRVRDQDLLPHFKRGEYGRGLLLASAALAGELMRARGKDPAVLPGPRPTGEEGLGFSFSFSSAGCCPSW